MDLFSAFQQKIELVRSAEFVPESDMSALYCTILYYNIRSTLQDLFSPAGTGPKPLKISLLGGKPRKFHRSISGFL